LGLVLFLVKLELSLGIVLTAYLIGNIVNFIINLIYVQKYVELGFAYDKKYWRHAISQAIPIGIVLVFGYIYYKIDSLMLSVMKGMTDVGIYGTAYKLLEVLQVVPAMFLGAAFPLITKYATTNDERVHPAFQKQFDFLMLIAVPIVFGTFVLASPIIAFIAGGRGEEFINSSTVSFLGNPITSVTCLKILVFSVGINFLSNLYNYMVVSLGKQRAMVAPTIGFAVLNIILNLALIPRFSYLGAAVATLLTELTVVIVTYFVTKKFIVLPLKLINFAKILLSGIIMAIVTFYLYSIGVNLFINILVAIVTYAVLVLSLKVITREMVIEILRKQD